MNQTERHIINKNHPHFAEIDQLCLLSKNLYNYVLYIKRQEYFDYRRFIDSGNDKKDFVFTSKYDLLKKLRKENQIDFRKLPTDVAAQVIFQVYQAFFNYFAAAKSGIKNAKLPKFKNKSKGKNVLTYNYKNITESKKAIKQGFYQLTKSDIKINIQTKHKVKLINLVPQPNCYFIDIIYEQQSKPTIINDNIASIDIGLNNLAAITFNTR